MRRLALLSLAVAVVAVTVLAKRTRIAPTETEARRGEESSSFVREDRAIELRQSEAPEPARRQPAEEAVVEESAAAAPGVVGATSDAVAGGIVLTVLQWDGVPVAGAETSCSWRADWGDYRDVRGVTDSLGRLRTAVPQPFQFESVDLVWRDQAYTSDAAHTPSFDPTSPGSIVLSLERIRPVVLRVVDARGEPIGGRALSLSQLELLEADPHTSTLRRDGVEAPESVVADAEGFVRIDLSEGLWRAEDAEGEGARTLVHVPRNGTLPEFRVVVPRRGDGRDVAVSLRLDPGVDTNADGALAAWLRGSFGALEDGDFGGRTVDFEIREGRLVAFVPNEGTWFVQAKGPGGSRGITAIPAGASAVTVTLKPKAPWVPKRVRGRVVDAASGAPIEASLTWRKWPFSGSRSGKRTDGAGTFDVEIGRDDEVLRVRATGYGWAAVGPFPAAPAEPIVIPLHPVHELEGTVVDSRGQPVDVTVHLHRSTAQTPAPCSIPATEGVLDDSIERVGTGLPGRFSFRRVTAHPVRLRVQPDDASRPPADVVVRGDAGSVRITLGDGTESRCDLIGTVRERVRGQPVAGLRVRASWREPTWQSVETVTDGHGGYALRGLPADGATLRLMPPEESSLPYAIRELALSDLATGEQVLDLEVDLSCTLHVQLVPERVMDSSLVLAVRSKGGEPTLLTSPAGYPENAKIRTDLLGRADLWGVPRGPVELLIFREWMDLERGVDPVSVVPLDLSAVPSGRVPIPFGQ
ncbi:MAG: hypothetical protein AAF726_13725 [Planctomycetota bacterium]